jgi:transposase
MLVSGHATETVQTARSFALPAAASACSAPPLPEGPCPVCPRLAAEFAPYRLAAYWRSMHERARAREDDLKAEVEALRALLLLREQQLFGKKSEASSGPSEASAPAPPPAPKRPRGQQPGKPGPKRRDHSRLPVVEEVRDLPEGERACKGCGQPFAPFAGTEDSEVLEVEVKAYRRLVRRKRYRPACSCGKHPGIVAAPPAGKAFPKSTLGVSVWAEILLDKYLFYRPTYRLLADWETRGLALSLGTVTDGLRKLLPLFEPVWRALAQRNREQAHWHADETRWMVFATVEGKAGHRWTLWVFHSEEAVAFVLDKGRAHDVPEDHLGPGAEGILSVDRYSAYKAMEQVKEGKILLAFCWAHARRDFLDAARSWPAQEEWAMGWVGRIGLLYKRNEERLEALQEPKAFAAKDAELRQHVEGMARQRDVELADPLIHPARQKALSSLKEHWGGLTVFVEHPEAPLDNNAAERMLRGPVVLRKNSRGSGAAWAGELAAMLFSVFQTLCLWDINPRAWLAAYLGACAEAGGKPPEALEGFLPWSLPEQKRREWSSKTQEEAEDSS